MTLQENLNNWMPAITAVIAVTSGVASLVNAVVRSRTSSGKQTPGWLLTIAAGLNFCAANFDKAVQFVKMASGTPTPQPSVPVLAPSMSNPAVAPAPTPAAPADPAAAVAAAPAVVEPPKP